MSMNVFLTALLGVVLTAACGLMGWAASELLSLRRLVTRHDERIGVLELQSLPDKLAELTDRLEDKMDQVQADIIKAYTDTITRVSRIEGALSPPPGLHRRYTDLPGEGH